MHGRLQKPSILVTLWMAMFASGMLLPLGLIFLPVALLVGLGVWWILRWQLPLSRAAAAAFAVSLPLAQLPPYLLYFTASSMGVGGLDGPPEWLVPLALASGGLTAGLIQFLGLPKSGRNFALWVAASVLAWTVSWLGDIPIKGMVVLSALLSGLVTGWAMLLLSAGRPTPRRSRVIERPGHAKRRSEKHRRPVGLPTEGKSR